MLEYLTQLMYREGIASRIIYSLSVGYTGIILLLFVLYLFRYRREVVIKLLGSSNGIYLCVTIPFVLSYSATLWDHFFNNEYEQFAFYNRVFTNLWWFVVWLGSKLLLPFAFLFKRARTTFALPIIIILLGYPNTWKELILSMTDSFLPATWSYTWQVLLLQHLQGFTLYAIVLAIAYWIKKRFDDRLVG